MSARKTVRKKKKRNIPIKTKNKTVEVQKSVNFPQPAQKMKAVQTHPRYIWRRDNYIIENNRVLQ